MSDLQISAADFEDVLVHPLPVVDFVNQFRPEFTGKVTK
jgi:hypothetical protein